jgi:hypothetical protein
MSRTRTISFCLIGTGVIAWAVAGRPLLTDHELEVPLNPFGINRGPYGEVLAMAMQGPIGKYAEVGISGAAHSHPAEAPRDDQEHDSGAGIPLKAKFDQLLSSLSELPEVRTNPNAASEGLKRHLRQQTERKLRLAYQLDPSNYGNYNSLHFFLTEPAVSTRRVLNAESVRLADETIRYCLAREDDPRPALTAAAAATNVLQLMFSGPSGEPASHSPGQMRQWLDLLDHSLARHFQLSRQWDESGNWELLSSMRIEECRERLIFVSKIREICEETIVRIEGGNQQHASN